MAKPKVPTDPKMSPEVRSFLEDLADTCSRIYFGEGPPTIAAQQGSLFLASNGTTTNDRAYINTDGGTTWTALTTAA